MASLHSKELLSNVSESVKREFKEQKYILSYDEFLDVFSKEPRKLIRNSAEYMLDMFKYFGVSEVKYGYNIIIDCRYNILCLKNLSSGTFGCLFL